MSNSSNLIRKIDFFEPLDERSVGRIAQVCIQREYSAGDHIVRQGDPGLGLYFITDGRVKVEIDKDGLKAPVAELQAGDFIGEISIIDNKPRTANVICLSDTSCLLLTRDSFQKILKKYPEIAVQMLKSLAARLRDTDRHFGRPQGVVPGAVQPPVPEASPVPGQPAELSDARKLKDLIAGAAGYIALVQSIMRVSLAVVGCPVTVGLETAACESFTTAIGQVKFVLFPAFEDHVVAMHAWADGDFTATFYQPFSNERSGGISVSRFTGRVRSNESAWFHVRTDGMTRLESAGPATAHGTRRFARPLVAHFGIGALESAISHLAEVLTGIAVDKIQKIVEGSGKSK